MKIPFKVIFLPKIYSVCLILVACMFTPLIQAETIESQKNEILESAQTIRDDLEELHQTGAISEILKTTAVSTLLAVTYGLIHDQITTRVCIEYYWTANHPRLLATNSPTLTGLLWGFISTWWVGAGLGGSVGIFAQAGSWPGISTEELLLGFGMVFTGVGTTTALTGVGSWAVMKALSYDPVWLMSVSGGYLLNSMQKRRNWLSVGMSNNAGYISGIVGAVMMWVYTMHQRYQKSLRAGAQPLVQSTNKHTEDL